MSVPIIYILFSILLLFFGSSWLAKGISTFAATNDTSSNNTRLNIAIIKSSSPLFAVSLAAAFTGHGNIAVSGVLGSVIFNLCIITGITSLLSPLKIKKQLLAINFAALIISALGFMAMFSDRRISRVEGALLLAGMILFTFLLKVLQNKNNDTSVEDVKSVSIKSSKWCVATSLILLSIIILAAGSGFLLEGAVTLAHLLNAGETIIGLTIVAACTSFPALLNSITLSRESDSDLAMQSILGSTIFNIIGVIGVSSLIHPLSAMAISNLDLYVMIGVILTSSYFLRSGLKLKPDEGVFLICMYLIYLYYLWPK